MVKIIACVLIVYFYIEYTYSIYVDDKNSDDEFLRTKNVVKYVASIRKTKEEELNHFGAGHFCGGTIIKHDTILTSAVCTLVITDPKLLTVVVGTPCSREQTNHTQIIKVFRIISHEGFNPKTFEHNIGLLKLNQHVKVDRSFTDVIALPNKSPAKGEICIVLGWGSTTLDGSHSDEIQYGLLIVQPNDKSVDNSFVRAKDQDNRVNRICSGDGGGPIILNNRIIGIISHGPPCGSNNIYSYYTDVYVHEHWILTDFDIRLVPSWRLLFANSIILYARAIISSVMNKQT